MLEAAVRIRDLLVDFGVGLQEILLYEIQSGGGKYGTNNTAKQDPPSSCIGSGFSSDEIGSLIELVTAE
jgi:hypothetical protein